MAGAVVDAPLCAVRSAGVVELITGDDRTPTESACGLGTASRRGHCRRDCCRSDSGRSRSGVGGNRGCLRCRGPDGRGGSGGNRGDDGGRGLRRSGGLTDGLRQCSRFGSRSFRRSSLGSSGLGSRSFRSGGLLGGCSLRCRSFGGARRRDGRCPLRGSGARGRCDGGLAGGGRSDSGSSMFGSLLRGGSETASGQRKRADANGNGYVLLKQKTPPGNRLPRRRQPQSRWKKNSTKRFWAPVDGAGAA